MAIVHFKKIYQPLFTNSARYFDLIGGRARGGSHAGTDYFLHLITRKKYFRGVFLRQVLTDVRGSLFQDFKDRIAENESVDENDFDINDHEMRIIYRPTGNMIISKGVTKTSGRTAKLKSLAGVTHVLIEETDELGEDDFDQLDISLRTIKTPVRIIRIFNPPNKDHWLWRDYNLLAVPDARFFGHAPEKRSDYYIATPKSDSKVVSIFSTYHDNTLYLDKTTMELLESYRVKKPHYYYTIVLGLISEGEKGRIFTGWEPITDQAFNNIDAKSIIGIDFGLASPAGITENKFVKNTMYIRQLNYDPLTNKQIALKLCQLGIKNQIIIGDSAEPHSISKLRRGWDFKTELADMYDTIADKITDDEGRAIYTIKPQYKKMVEGFNIYPAAKGPGSIVAGISLMQDYTVFVTEGSADMWKEYRGYKWALDKNKNPTDEPIDDFNHLIDPSRYCAQAKTKYY